MEAIQLNTEQQIDRIKLIMLRKNIDECNRCDLTGYFMYKQYGHKLCPNCDSDLIEDYKISKLRGE